MASAFSLGGRVAAVTGAGEGIGRQIALAFAASGAELLLVGRRRNKLDLVAKEISGAGGKAHVLAGDVTASASVAEISARVAGLAGSRRPIILVNNAGFGFTRPALETTEEEWDSLFAVHLRGTFFLCRAVAPLMIEQGYGKIINMSSTWSSSTAPGKSAYAAAKAAVSQLTASLSTEWAPHGIRVNALAPTTTMTEFTARKMDADPQRAARLLSKIPLGRYATPDDITGPAIFLASAASDFVSGHTLFVDGGWHAAS